MNNNLFNKRIKGFLIFLLLFIFVYVYSSRDYTDDLLNYFISFKQYTNFSDFLKGPLNIKAQPVLYLTFVFFNLLDLPFRFFLVCIIVLNLYFEYKILRVFYAKNLALYGLFVFMLIPLNMSLSMQILRQYLSMQIIFYVLINKNNNYLLLILSTLLHSTSLIFLPLIFLKSKINMKNLLFSIIFFFAFYFSPLYLYLEYRLNKGSYYSFEITGIVPYLITGIPLAFVLLSNHYSKIFKYIHIYLFLIIVFAFNAEIQFRYMFGIYILFPVIVVQLFLKFEKKTQSLLKTLFLIALFIWTNYYISYGPYKYLL